MPLRIAILKSDARRITEHLRAKHSLSISCVADAVAHAVAKHRDFIPNFGFDKLRFLGLNSREFKASSFKNMRYIYLKDNITKLTNGTESIYLPGQINAPEEFEFEIHDGYVTLTKRNMTRIQEYLAL